MFKVTLLVLLLYYYRDVQGWGYRYSYDPITGGSNLWTYLPGHEKPVVYAYPVVQGPHVPWPQVYTVEYDGLLPGQPNLPSQYNSDPNEPNLYRYRGPDGQFRFKCKTDAYYNEYLKKCVWKPGSYKNRG